MQEVVITGPREVRIVSRAEDPMTPTSIRLRSLYSGISHGTEMSFYRGTAPQLTMEIDDGLFYPGGPVATPYPVRHGYEMVAEVLEVGSQVESFAVGDIAWTGNAGHPDTFVCDTAADRKPFFCERAPDGAAPTTGVFLALGGVAYDGFLTSHLRLGESAVVSGLGAIGMLTVQLAEIAGVSPLIAIDPIDARLDKAAGLGAEYILNPGDATAQIVRDVSGGGVDAAIETSGNWAALHEAIRVTASGYGRVVAVGFYQGAGTDLRLGEEFTTVRSTRSERRASSPSPTATIRRRGGHGTGTACTERSPGCWGTGHSSPAVFSRTRSTSRTRR
jgi:2-desacetyl-2-hydroxyethyl bacteriochlorophyllide A dehydrogenase